MNLLTTIDFLDPFYDNNYNYNYYNHFMHVELNPFEYVTDLIQTPSLRHIVETPSFGLHRRRRKSLFERVAELESRFENVSDGKYTCRAEIEGPEGERKYKWTAEMKGGRKREEKWKAEVCSRDGRKCKWTSEIQGFSGFDKNKNNTKITRALEIHNDNHAHHHHHHYHKDIIKKRSRAPKHAKGKKKVLSPQDAAMMIQTYFRSYLIRRLKAVRALRELAVAKAKLKEIRALFNNFSYRRRIAQDAGECQKFSERIIVLLLTVDAIEGSDFMVCGAKRSMTDELETMLNVVDPQPCGKSLSMRRRTFDMPDGVIRKEIADGVAQVVQMLDGEENSSSTFEVCL